MSRAYLEITALVLAAFALGLLVGWLAWHVGPDRELGRQTRARRPAPSETGETLPKWQGERAATKDHAQPNGHRGQSGATVVVRPQAGTRPDPGRSPAGS